MWNSKPIELDRDGGGLAKRRRGGNAVEAVIEEHMLNRFQLIFTQFPALEHLLMLRPIVIRALHNTHAADKVIIISQILNRTKWPDKWVGQAA